MAKYSHTHTTNDEETKKQNLKCKKKKKKKRTQKKCHINQTNCTKHSFTHLNRIPHTHTHTNKHRNTFQKKKERSKEIIKFANFFYANVCPSVFTKKIKTSKNKTK